MHACSMRVQEIAKAPTIILTNLLCSRFLTAYYAKSMVRNSVVISRHLFTLQLVKRQKGLIFLLMLLYYIE